MKSSIRTFIFAADVSSWSAKRKSSVFVFVSFSHDGPETRDAMYPTPEIGTVGKLLTVNGVGLEQLSAKLSGHDLGVE
jgi:hypothetical protein